MSLLHDFVEKKHCIFVEEAADWRDAIRIGCKPLLADGTIDERYQERVIQNVEEFGLTSSCFQAWQCRTFSRALKVFIKLLSGL